MRQDEQIAGVLRLLTALGVDDAYSARIKGKWCVRWANNYKWANGYTDEVCAWLEALAYVQQEKDNADRRP